MPNGYQLATTQIDSNRTLIPSPRQQAHAVHKGKAGQPWSSGLVFGKTYVVFDWLEQTALKDLGVDEVPNERDFLRPQVIQKETVMQLC